jgi:hypothetical protein
VLQTTSSRAVAASCEGYDAQAVVIAPGVTMTRQYIVGELSIRIAGLCPARRPGLAAALTGLQHRVECAPLGTLSSLVSEAINPLTWRTGRRWRRATSTGSNRRQRCAELRDFADGAGLLS